MNVVLTQAVVSDAEKLQEMQRICFAPHLERYQDYETSPANISLEKMQSLIQKGHFYKIFYDDELVGAMNIKDMGEKIYKLHVVNILPGYQNLGIGQKVIELAEELFSDAVQWRLETLSDMPGNRHVYEKAGYHFTGQTEKINDKLTVVYYEKDMS